MLLSEGIGVAWSGNERGTQDRGIRREWEELADLASPQDASERILLEKAVQLQDKRRLGIATLGALSQHPRIAAFREFVEGWYLSYFTPDAARSLPLAGPQRRLSIHGDNLANVVQYMQREHPDEFDSILKKIAGRVPGIDKIDTQSAQKTAESCSASTTVALRTRFTLSRCPTAR